MLHLVPYLDKTTKENSSYVQPSWPSEDEISQRRTHHAHKVDFFQPSRCESTLELIEGDEMDPNLTSNGKKRLFDTYLQLNVCEINEN